MDFINSGIRQITSELIQPRKYNYCLDALDHFLDSNPDVTCKHSIIKNKRGENLFTMLLKRTISDTCVIYAHGLGSNKIQVLSLVRYLKQVDYHFCAFDFSGSGRSDGEYTTYGLREQDDVNAVLGALDATRQYKRYILWGRSMGGAAIVLSQSRNLNPKVQCLILDSPFSSFEKAAVQIASRNSIFPERMLNFLIGPIKEHMQKEYKSLNPFQINIGKAIASIESHIMLIYSKDDSIVSCQHSKQIGKHCRRSPIQLQISEDHNKPRTAQTYLKVLKFIQQSMQHFDSRVRRSRSRGRGISVSSKENVPTSKSIRRSVCSSDASDRILGKQNQSKKMNCISIGSFGSTYSSEDLSPKGSKAAIIKSMLLERQEKKLRQNNGKQSIKFKTFKKYSNIFT